MIENKIARVCWNTNYWQKTSGPEGKNKKSYEKLTGYGHEEWLLDTTNYLRALREKFSLPLHYCGFDTEKTF